MTHQAPRATAVLAALTMPPDNTATTVAIMATRLKTSNSSRRKNKKHAHLPGHGQGEPEADGVADTACGGQGSAWPTRHPAAATPTTAYRLPRSKSGSRSTSAGPRRRPGHVTAESRPPSGFSLPSVVGVCNRRVALCSPRRPVVACQGEERDCEGCQEGSIDACHGCEARMQRIGTSGARIVGHQIPDGRRQHQNAAAQQPSQQSCTVMAAYMSYECDGC